MHRGVREEPERVCFVGQKVGGDEGILVGPDDFPAERAVSPASIDPIHALQNDTQRRLLPIKGDIVGPRGLWGCEPAR